MPQRCYCFRGIFLCDNSNARTGIVPRSTDQYLLVPNEPMCPSYLRIRLPLAEALKRFADWIALPALGPPQKTAWNKVNDLACKDGDWRCNVVLFIYESGDWTVFEDQSGYLSTFTSDKWLKLAGRDELVFAGYNDSNSSGHLIVIQQGQIVREFLDNTASPQSPVNRGRLGFEGDNPINDWIGAASFVDDDEIVISPDYGLLWMFGERG